MNSVAWSDIEAKYARFAFRMDAGGRRRLWAKLTKLIGNNVQLVAAMEELRDRRIAAGEKSHPQTYALSAWLTAMRNGKSLATAIRGWASDEEVMLISAGEAGGSLEQSLKAAGITMAARNRIRGAIVSGLAYPVFLSVIAFAVLYLFGYKIVPAFQASLPPTAAASWHGLAAAMVAISVFAKHWLWMVAILVLALTATFALSLRRFDGPLRIWLDQYPPYSIYRILLGSTWLISIAALVEAGLRIETAMQQLADTASPWLRRRLRAAIAGMRSGRNLGEALAQAGDCFPDREIIQDMAVYARLSGFDVALATLGNEWLTESVERISSMMKVIFGVAILSVGALLAFMVGGMMNMELQLSQIMQQAVH